MEKPLVSVLMTAFNRENYISDAIESVISSTYTNFELIIVDDGSKDKTVEIAKQYAIKDSRVKIFINEVNLGDYPNRNKAASYASGKYLKYVDADDYIYPWGLQILVDNMEQNPEAGWGLCSLIQINEKPYPLILANKKIFEHHYFVSALFQKAPLSAIIKKEVFETVGGFKPFRMVGDFEMWHKLALHSPLLLMPDGIVWYRSHSEQEFSSYKKYWSKYASIELHYLTHPNNSFDKDKINTILDKNKILHQKEAIKELFKGNYKEAKLRWIVAKQIKKRLHLDQPKFIN
jgi:glycosyltransferase involved in cell wall biosynthesis